METLSDIIKSLREIGLTQAEVGAKLEISQAYVCQLEKGERGGRTSFETMDRAKRVRDEIMASRTA
ncbi:MULTISPECIES: helix-turn-helix domain-containing protein [Herbaspirillum]|uniref:helix-turn-helix domain-containing protein n=1 Tax=Herbaspirillum TaxID=963 RepID=UPI000C09ED84|nr:MULTISPECIES: helix-turn-helix transcriptional regulator [Herbaspirillum]MAF04386.1 hypothetical protein [Herbaspirillum sp.]MEE1636378.1 helix-turn-helix transcriptional regulator [Herbaspirillum huttiense NC40101]|tara:strand:+ start:3191 stop:3388 length:198 start_codon:yes stop_codon:yes gene_type:complete